VSGIVGRWRVAIGGARLVREPVRFALRELLGRRVARLYRPRGIRYRVWVRHSYPGSGSNSYDTLPLHEIVADRAYAPPEPVAAALRERDEAKIVDLGGHVGYFGVFVLAEVPHASLVSFEPEPSHAGLLRRCIDVNDLGARWGLVEACAATTDGTVSFLSGLSVRSHVAVDDSPAIEVAAKDVFPYLDGADLLKIDIEGSEWEILFDERLGQVHPAAIVLEYHSVRGVPATPSEPLATAWRALATRWSSRRPIPTRSTSHSGAAECCGPGAPRFDHRCASST
jgi:FkbM family methyltransferase